MDSHLALLVAGLLGQPVHDVYTTLQSPTGGPCCGGDDCEPVTYRLQPGGDVEIYSRRYGTVIRVHHDAIVWSPVPGSPYEAHWCGKRRGPTLYGRIPPVTVTDPDPNFVTYCTFIDPGGS